MKDPTPRDFVPVVIIGGGMSGIAMACQLNRKLGFTDYIIYDRAEGIGGTWWMNNCESLHPHSTKGLCAV